MNKNIVRLLRRTLAVGLSLCLTGSSVSLAEFVVQEPGRMPVGSSQASIAGAGITHVLTIPSRFTSFSLAGGLSPASSPVNWTQPPAGNSSGVTGHPVAVVASQAGSPQFGYAFDVAHPAVVAESPLQTAGAAVFQAGHAVEEHPVLAIINELQRAGVSVSDLPKTAADVEALKTAIEQHVPKGKARQDLLAFANALSFSQGAAQGSELDKLYENVSEPYRAPGLMPVAQAPAGGFWSWMSRRKLGWFGLKAYAAWRVQQAVKPIDIEALNVRKDKLRYVPAPELLPKSTEDIPPSPKEVVGQPHGLKDLAFGLEMEGPSYNVVVTGPDGSGRETAVQLLLQGPNGLARKKPTPRDSVAATNFNDRDEKIFLDLAPGTARPFQATFQKILAMLKQVLPEQLMSGPVAKQKKQMHAAFEQLESQEFDNFNAEHTAKLQNGRYGVRISPTEEGIAVDVMVDGKLLNDAQIDALAKKEGKAALLAKGQLKQARAAFRAAIDHAFTEANAPALVLMLNENHATLVATVEQTLKDIVPQAAVQEILGKLNQAESAFKARVTEVLQAQQARPDSAKILAELAPDKAAFLEAVTGVLLEARAAVSEATVTRDRIEQAKAAFSADIERITSGEEFGQLIGRLSQKHMETHAQMEELDQQTAGEIIFQLGQGLFALSEDEAYLAFQQRMAKRKAALDQKVGEATILDKFGIQLEADGEGGLSVRVTYKDPALLDLGPLAQLFGAAITPVVGGDKDLTVLKAKDSSIPADLTWEQLSKAAEDAARGFVDAYNAMQEENQADFAKLPQPSLESRKAKSYVKGLLVHLAQHYQDFMPTMVQKGDVMAMLEAQQKDDPAKAYRVDIISTNMPGSGAPVVIPKSARFKKLFGYYEDKMRFPMLGMAKEAPGGPQIVTGKFLQANGGYIVLDLLDILKEAGAYETILRMLKSGVAEIREEGFMSFLLDRGDHYEVPVKVKVIFMGSPLLAMLLKHYDPDFDRLFKITAEFEAAIRITSENVAGYLKFMRDTIDKSGGAMLHFAQDGIQAVYSAGSSRADTNEKLTAQFGLVEDLMNQSSKWAEIRLQGLAASRAAQSGKTVQEEIQAMKEEGSYLVAREDVEKAEEEIRERVGSYKRRLYELFAQGSFHVDLHGAKKDTGTGVAVMGDFGVPAKIEAKASARSSGETVLSIEQDAKLTGSSFDQSLGVIKGILEGLFGELRDLPFKVRIKFVQNYGGIDGDSATDIMTALTLISLAQLNVRQGIAVTGSAYLEGKATVIGGLKEKIAGVWDVVVRILRQEKQDPNYLPVKEDGLGFAFPADNIRQLALRADVARAVEEGRLRLYPYAHISQLVEILAVDDNGNRVPYAQVLDLIRQRAARMRRAARRP